MNKFRYTTIGQMLQILKTYSINAILFAIVWVMLANLWSTGVGRYIYVVISLVTMFFTLYGCGEQIAKDDKKPYANRGICIKRSLYMPCLVMAAQILFILMFKLTWMLGSDGDNIQEVWAVATNLMSYAWFAPFGTIAGMNKGSFSVLGYVLMFLIPEGGYVLGYLAAAKGYDISEKLFGFMYEKKNEKKSGVKK